MAIKTNTPEIVALKQAVEKRFGHPIESRTDFTLLAYDIERTTNNHIAEVFGYHPYYLGTAFRRSMGTGILDYKR